MHRRPWPLPGQPVSEAPPGPGDRDPLRRLLVLPLDLPEQGTGLRARRAGPPAPEGPSRRWTAGFLGLLAAAVVAGAALTFVGVQTVRDSTAGRTVSLSNDPSAPGFEALLEPTPTLLLAHEHEGALVSLALLGLGSGDAGGSILLIPPATMIRNDAFEGPLSVAYAFGGGIDAIDRDVQRLLGVGIAEHLVIDDGRWATLTQPAAPLVIDNPDPVEDFPAGPIELAPDGVGAWLRAIEPDESDLSRLFRQQLFWEAWLAEVAASADESIVPGELDSGLGRFVRGLAAGQRQIATLPVFEDSDDDGAAVFTLDEPSADALVSRLVPFPRAAWEGARTRVRLLDGTGTPDHALQAAPPLVAADAEIVIVGNAERFDQRETEVRYHDPSQRGAAERLREALGTGRVVEDTRQVDAFDVTIVLGTDA